MSDEKKTVEERVESEHYGPGTPCSHCGEEIDEYSAQWTEYCHRHHMQRTEPLLMDLKDLADKWERDAAGNPYMNECAQELREVLEQYE